MPLGERHHLIPGAVAIDAGPDDERGPRAAIEPRADGLDQRRVRMQQPAHRARRHGLARTLPVVDRNRDERGSARLLHRHVVGAGDRRRDVFPARRLAAPLHVRIRQPGRVGGIQERLVRQDRSRLLAGGDDQRRAVPVGGEDVPHRVADARRRVQVDERRVTGGLREAVGHPHHHRLLQAQHVAEIVGEVLEQRQLGRPGIPEHRGHPELAQQADDGVANGRHAGGNYGAERIDVPPYCCLERRTRESTRRARTADGALRTGRAG